MKYDIRLNGKIYVVEVDEATARILEKKPGAAARVEELTDLDVPDFDFSPKDDSSSRIAASLPGTVLSVAVRKGDCVVKGQTLLVLESMKMENAVTAPADGKIEEISVRVGDSVTKDQPLIALKLAEMAV